MAGSISMMMMVNMVTKSPDMPRRGNLVIHSSDLIQRLCSRKYPTFQDPSFVTLHLETFRHIYLTSSCQNPVCSELIYIVLVRPYSNGHVVVRSFSSIRTISRISDHPTTCRSF